MDHVFSFNSKPKDDALKAKSMAFMKISEVNMRLEEKLGLTLSALLSLFSPAAVLGDFTQSRCTHTLDIHDAHTLCTVTMHPHFF